MYYVIKKQSDNPLQCFMGFAVPKYIASKNNDTVIFEFSQNGKLTRKWVKKDDIILFTDDKKFFIKTMDQFKAVETTQKKLVEAAREKLNESIDAFTENVNAEINEFNEIKKTSDVPCILKDM